MIGLPRSSQAVFLAIIAATCFSSFDAHSQSAGTSAEATRIIRPTHPVWLLEQPDADNPLLTARTFGSSAYGDFHVKATLEISCHPVTRGAGVTLQVDPSALGFDSDPFEGPDATAHGPLHITTANRRATDHQVSGFWAGGGAFQVGTLFAITSPIPPDELAYWASVASGGQPLRLSLAPATAGAKPLTAEFSLPQNNEGLRQVIQPCL